MEIGAINSNVHSPQCSLRISMLPLLVVILLESRHAQFPFIFPIVFIIILISFDYEHSCNLVITIDFTQMAPEQITIEGWHHTCRSVFKSSVFCIAFV